MTCPICKHGKMDKGFTSLIFEDGRSFILCCLDIFHIFRKRIQHYPTFAGSAASEDTNS